MALVSSDELHSFTDAVEPPAKRLRLDDAAQEPRSTFDAPPLTPPDEPATPLREAVTAQETVPQVNEPFYDAGEAEEPGDTLAALNALLAGYDDNGTPLPVADPLDLCVDPAPAVPPGAEFEEQNVLDRLASILADTPDTPCAIAAYPSPISIASATPAPSELSFESRDSSASVEPESGGAATSQHAGGGQKAKSSQRKYWTPEQDAALIAAKEDPGKRDWTWKEIAELLNCGHRSVQCRARYLLLKDKQKIENPEDDPARPPKLKNQGRSFFTANDDAIILAHLLGEVWIDWSVVGASLNPPRTGDSCYQRSRKLRKKTVAERRAILQAYEPPSPASRAGTPAACPSPAFFAAVAPSTSANAKPDAPTERAERGAVTTPPAATADAPEASPSPSLAATSDIQIDPSLYAS